MIHPWTTERKILAGFTAALAVLCVVAGVSVYSTLELLHNWKSVAHTHQVLDNISHLQSAVLQLATNARLYAANESETTFAEWEQTRATIEADEKNIAQLTAENTGQQQRLARFQGEMNKRIAPTVRGADAAMLEELWKPGVLRVAYETLLAMEKDEQRLLTGRDERVSATAYETLVTIALASAVAMVLVCGSAALIFRDLKKRQLAETQAHEARQAAVAANMAKSAFLANISHEVRTPLTAILGYADLLMAPTVDERERHRYLLTMRRSGEHLLTIINDVLDLSKIEAGRMELDIIDCRLVEILADVDSLIRPRAAGKNIAFALDYASPLPDRILTDATRLRQVLVNLANNAVKFTEHGSVRMVVRYERADGSQRPMLSIDVVDTGIGISQEKQQTLFQPFTQADVSTTRRYGGTGLGLSISRRLAQLMGGELGVTSELQRGSTFRLVLPVEAVPGTAMLQSGEVQHVLSLARSSEPTMQRISAKVLFAEDGPENREVISLHLQRAGCNVTTAEDGQVAVTLALAAVEKNEPFDVILMDMQMPVMDGYTATSTLRSKGYRGAIVALTANAMTEDRERCLQAGCDDYAGKPVDIPVLVRMIEEVSGKRGLVVPPVMATLLHDPVLLNLTRKFGESTSAAVAHLREMIERQSLTEVAEAAHKLAGAGGSYGFHNITLAAKQVERLARINAPTAEIRQQLDQVDLACNAARNAIAQATLIGQAS